MKNLLKNFLFILFNLILSMYLLQAQEYDVRFNHISVKEGLSQSTVFTICQDSKGFMWFGTASGLNKYDGYKFTVYKHDPDDSNSLSNNFILSICEDNTGILWIGTNGGGLNKFDRKKERFTNYTYQPQNPNSLSDNTVWSIYESSHSQESFLWIGTYGGGLKKFNPETEEFTCYTKQQGNRNSLNSNRVRTIFRVERLVTLPLHHRPGLASFSHPVPMTIVSY